MRPATSGRSITDSSERRLPTAVIVCGIGARATLIASTVIGAGLGAAAVAAGGRRLRGSASRAMARAAGRTRSRRAAARSTPARRRLRPRLPCSLVQNSKKAKRQLCARATVAAHKQKRAIVRIRYKFFVSGKKPPMKLPLRVAFACHRHACALQPAPALAADAFPTHTVRLVVPFPPGGSLDIVGRAIAQKLTEAWGQSVVVENKPGAGGNIGADFVAKSRARRLHGRDGRAVDARRQSEPVPEDAVRRGQGLRADHAGRHHAQRAGA